MPASGAADKLKTSAYFVFFLGICIEFMLTCGAHGGNNWPALRTNRRLAEKFIKDRQMTLFIPQKAI
jgi:hypothetical protein